MADEAVVRIVLSDGGGSTRAPAPTGTPPPTTTAPTTAPTPTTTPTPTAPPQPQRDFVNDLVQGIAGANRHVLIEGQSGSGKSLLTRHIAFQRMQQGEEVSVVDTHTPEAWQGAKQVFQGTNEQAGTAAAQFLKEQLEARKAEGQAAKLRGEVPDFKPMTIVFSDFARLMKDTPALQKEFQTTLTEARKFNIAIVADTTAMTGAATGVKGITDVINNFAQKIKLTAPTATTPYRTATMGAEEFQTPVLPEYKERIDYSLVKPPPPPKPEVGEERERQLLELEARAALEVARKQQAAVEDSRRAEVALDDEKHRELELEARAALAVVRDKQAAVEEARRAEVALEDEQHRMLELEARAALETVRKQQKAAEAAIPVAGVAFDPVAIATKQRESERQRAQVRAAYKQQYGGGEDEESQLAKVLDVANQFRGTIGGFAGTMIGAVMDTTAAFRKAQVDLRNRKKEAALSGDPEAIKAAEGAGAAEGVGVAAVAIVAAVGAFKETISVFSNAVDRYAEYSPTIAQAQAEGEVKNMLADMARAEKYSQQLAEYTTAQFEMQRKWEDAKMKFMAMIEPIITRIVNGLGAFGDDLSAILDFVKGILEWLGIKDAEKRWEDEDDFDDIFEGDPGTFMPVPGVGF